MVFDPEAEAFFRLQAKAELRKQMRALRAAIPRKRAELARQKIVERVLSSPALRAGTRHRLVLAHARSQRSRCPAHRGSRARERASWSLFRSCGAKAKWRCSSATPQRSKSAGNGFASPRRTAAEIGNDGLLVIVPALAVDETGQRIGYGKGFYDRLLARIAPPASTVAVAYDFQIVAEVPGHRAYRRVDVVVTDARTVVVA